MALLGFINHKRTIPLEEQSRAVAVVFGGLNVGSVAGLFLAPPLIQNLGWESVFYLFSLLGIGWYVGFRFLEGQGSWVGCTMEGIFSK